MYHLTKCDVCGEERDCHVYAVPDFPTSDAYCPVCDEMDAQPLWLLRMKCIIRPNDEKWNYYREQTRKRLEWSHEKMQKFFDDHIEDMRIKMKITHEEMAAHILKITNLVTKEDEEYKCLQQKND